MTRLYTLLLLLAALPLHAQILTIEPAFPTADDAVTLTFDATQGTGGLANCNCDVYLHTGVITPASNNDSDWQNVVTTWGQANPAWQLQPVEGQPNKYTYTISPSIREYYGVDAGTEILRMAFVFRDATGGREGKGPGNSDLFLNVFDADIELSTVLLAPASAELAVGLGQPIPVNLTVSQPATIRLLDNGTQLTQVTEATELIYELIPTVEGEHRVDIIAEAEGSSDTTTFTYTADLRIDRTSPATDLLAASFNQEVNVQVDAYVQGTITLYLDEVAVRTYENTSAVDTTVRFNAPGAHEVRFEIDYQGRQRSTSFIYLLPGTIKQQPVPDGMPDGITVISPDSVYLQLQAPGKTDVFVIGNFSDWGPRLEYQMARSTDQKTFWIGIGGLDGQADLFFQYLMNENIRRADPLSTLILDPFDDRFIPEVTYPDLPPYPDGQTENAVSWVRLDAPTYEWAVDSFQAPPKERLMIYELLLRDFIDRHDYATLIDTLDYIQNLGVNAIELMPVSEFEGNISWGYNPSFHMALDKYYGTPEHFKEFVDSCHARGMAVIVDVVYNHAFSQSPLARMWWDDANFRPSEDNPYLNPEARHPFNVGYDFNHESDLTRRFVDQVMTYWLEEFRVDGFRFDLSKGFTQRRSTNIGSWNAYDGPRIEILKHYADVVWAANPNAYVILEHFSDFQEEEELTSYGNGMLTWGGGGIHNQYLEGAMGFPSDLSDAFFDNRGYSAPSLIAYIESHDEERLITKALEFGNSNGNYSTRDLVTALRRAELANTFFYTIPGPKMLWQFGEVGYDFSINYCPNGTIDGSCRVDPKPIRWDYFQEPDRRRLYEVIRSLTALRNQYEVFHTDDFDYRLASPRKVIHLNSPDVKVAVLGNFDVTEQSISNPFQEAGTWYNYFTGDSILVADPAEPITLAPGGYRLYSTVKLADPPGGFVTSQREVPTEKFRLAISPNPTDGTFQLQFNLPQAGTADVGLYDLHGRRVATLFQGRTVGGLQQFTATPAVPSGVYLVQLRSSGGVQTKRVVVNK